MNKIEEEEEDEDSAHKKSFKKNSPAFPSAELISVDGEVGSSELGPNRRTLFRTTEQFSPLKDREDSETLIRVKESSKLFLIFAGNQSKQHGKRQKRSYEAKKWKRRLT